jgi:hypothetical protein
LALNFNTAQQYKNKNNTYLWFCHRHRCICTGSNTHHVNQKGHSPDSRKVVAVDLSGN